MIRIKNLCKKFGSLTAVNDLSLEVSPGEIFGFLGPNGAGKTTTLKIMAGVLAPTSGDVEILGFSVLGEPSQTKALTGYIPDRPYLYDKLTGLEFLHFVGGLYGLLPKETDQEIEERLNLFDLWDWRNELIESYSHGMKQRLIICSALIHHPRVLIVDEPMVGLDPKGVRIVTFSERKRPGNDYFSFNTHPVHRPGDLRTDQHHPKGGLDCHWVHRILLKRSRLEVQRSGRPFPETDRRYGRRVS
jgi:ABC-2 type transport system ATP-binding protein